MSSTSTPSFSRPDQAAPAAARSWEVSWPEFIFILVILAGGFLFLRDAAYWGRHTYVGTAQFGDAEFWWNGALHFAQGIVAENPNISYRMGYATFGGLIIAVFGPEYSVFQQILLAFFLTTAAGLYLSLRHTLGRVAAATVVVFLVFNPYTAEWLAISTSDALGFVLNLAAVLALVHAVRDRLDLRALGLFGLLFSCASLTRPLMTLYIAPAVLTVVVVGWPDWRRTARALAVLLAAFMLPTLAWMGFMGITTGNFALTGASQDSSAFYAASDPQIQTWHDTMYTAVNDAAKVRFHTDAPTPRQLNAEFWTMTRANYLRHWRYHLHRVAHNLESLAKFTPAQATMHSPLGDTWRQRLKWLLTAALVALALRRQRQWSAVAILVLGSCWVLQPPATLWLVLGGAGLGLAALLVRRPVLFLWASYWWVGAAALYLTGGTWEPPAAPFPEISALGYRLGFQFLFTNDLLIVGLLGCIAAGRTPAYTLDEGDNRLLLPSASAARLLRRAGLLGLALASAMLLCGAVIVASRIAARRFSTPVRYPDPAGLTQTNAARGARVLPNLDYLREAMNLKTGRPVLMTGTSSGFIWNLTGQRRSMLLLYQQDNLQPIELSPRHLYVEAPRHLRERQWMNRRGAWVLRAFPDLAPPSNLPYYYEMPAVEAFIPLAADGKSYATEQAVVFPLAKSATQLAAAGNFVFTGAQPKWAQDSGALQFPRRFALSAETDGAAPAWELSLGQARGQRSLRFALQFESKNGQPVHVRLETAGGTPLWELELKPGEAPVAVQPILADATAGLRFTSGKLRAGETLWFYELVLEADDFTQ